MSSSGSKFKFLARVLADPELSVQAKCVVAALLVNFHNTRTGQCNPGFGEIAKAVGRHRSNIVPVINELKTCGWLEIGTTKGGSQRNTNRYRFDFSRRTSAEDGTSTEDGTGGVPNSQRRVSNSVLEPLKNPSRPSGERGGESEPPPRRAPSGARAEEAEAAFATFWAQYPKRQGEDGAKREFLKAVVAGADPKAIVAGAMRYAAAMIDEDAQYIAMPAGWLRDGRWKDVPSPRTKRAAKHSGDNGSRRGGKPNPVEEALRAGEEDDGRRS